MNYRNSKFKKLKYFIPIALLSISLLSACSNNSNDEKTSENSSTSTVESSNLSDIEDNNVQNTDFTSYSLDDFVNNFSVENFELKDALRDKILNIALDTTSKNSYSAKLLHTDFESGKSLETSILFKDNNCKITSPDVFYSQKRFTSVYKNDENALYYYDIDDPTPAIEKYTNFISESYSKMDIPGAIGSLSPYDFSITDPTSIEFGEIDGKKTLLFTRKSDSILITNHIDINTGFSILRSEKYLVDNSFVDVSETKLTEFELNPEIKPNAFELPILGKIQEVQQSTWSANDGC